MTGAPRITIVLHTPPDVRVWEPLPLADEIADRLGARHSGANNWRLPHLCGGEHHSAPIPPNSGYSLLRLPDGGAAVHCFYGCDTASAYAALRRALGNLAPPPDTAASATRAARPRRRDNGRPPVTAAEAARRNYAARNSPPPDMELIDDAGWPRPPYQPQRTYSDLLNGISARWTAWTDYTLADGGIDTTFRRFPARGAKTLWTVKPDGAAPRTKRGMHPAFLDNPSAAPDDPVVVVEGEKAAAALAYYQPAGWRIASGGGESLLKSVALDSLLAAPRVMIWPDNDAPGIAAAITLAQRLIDAGKRRRDVILLDTADIAAAARLHDPDIDTDGIDAADIPPELALMLIRDGAKRAGDTAGNDRVLRRPRRARDEYCVSIRKRIEYQDTTGRGAVQYLSCRDCDGCVAYQRKCDMARYAFGRHSGPQSILTYPYDTPDECRRMVRAVHGIVTRHNDGANRPSVQVRDGIRLVMVFAEQLPPDIAGPVARALERAGKGTLSHNEMTPPQFHALVPPARKQHTHLSGDGDGAAPALLSVKFSDDWTEFWTPARDYAYGDGVVLDLDSPAPPGTADEHTALVMWRRKRGREWAAFANVADWTAAMRADISAELWDAYVAADTPAARYEVAAEIRAATGYAGPVTLLTDAITGDRQCHRLLRARVAGSPPELITPPRPELRRTRRFARPG